MNEVTHEFLNAVLVNVAPVIRRGTFCTATIHRRVLVWGDAFPYDVRGLEGQRFKPWYVITEYDCTGRLFLSQVHIRETIGPNLADYRFELMRHDDSMVLAPDENFMQTDKLPLSELSNQTVYHSNWPSEIQMKITANEIRYKPIRHFERVSIERDENDDIINGSLVASGVSSSNNPIEVINIVEDGLAERLSIAQTNRGIDGLLLHPGANMTYEESHYGFDAESPWKFLKDGRVYKVKLICEPQESPTASKWHFPTSLPENISSEAGVNVIRVRDDRPRNPDFPDIPPLTREVYVLQGGVGYYVNVSPAFHGMNLSSLLSNDVYPHSTQAGSSTWYPIGGWHTGSGASQINWVVFVAFAETLVESYLSYPVKRYVIFKAVRTIVNTNNGATSVQFVIQTKGYELDLSYDSITGPEFIELVSEELMPDEQVFADWPWKPKLEITPEAPDWVDVEVKFVSTNSNEVDLQVGQVYCLELSRTYQQKYWRMFSMFYKEKVPGVYFERGALRPVIGDSEATSAQDQNRPYYLVGTPTEEGTYSVTIYGIRRSEESGGQVGDVIERWKSTLVVNVQVGNCPSPTNHAALGALIKFDPFTETYLVDGNLVWSGFSLAGAFDIVNVDPESLEVTGNPGDSYLLKGEDAIPFDAILSPGISMPNGTYNVTLSGLVQSGTHANCPIRFSFVVIVDIED